MSLFSKKEDPVVLLSTSATGDGDKRYKELEELTGLSGAELDALIAATYSNMQLSCLQKYKSETSNVRFYWDGCKARDIDLLEEFRATKPVEDIVCLHKTT